MVGLVGFEPTTPALSRRCSNQLSYRPTCIFVSWLSAACPYLTDKASSAGSRIYSSVELQPISVGAGAPVCFSRKEVIQPHLPIRLPCYDFTPVMNHTVVNALPKVKLSTSCATRSHGVTGGVYKARERIHRNILICDY